MATLSASTSSAAVSLSVNTTSGRGSLVRPVSTRATVSPAAPVPAPSSHTRDGRQGSPPMDASSPSRSAAATRTQSAMVAADIAVGDLVFNADVVDDDVNTWPPRCSSGFGRCVASGMTCADVAHGPTHAATASSPRTPRYVSPMDARPASGSTGRHPGGGSRAVSSSHHTSAHVCPFACVGVFVSSESSPSESRLKCARWSRRSRVAIVARPPRAPTASDEGRTRSQSFAKTFLLDRHPTRERLHFRGHHERRDSPVMSRRGEGPAANVAKVVTLESTQRQVAVYNPSDPNEVRAVHNPWGHT